MDYEYGDLKEVVVGIPYGIYPDLDAVPWLQEAIKVLPESEAAKLRARSGQDTISLGKYDVMEKENLALIDVLKQYGVKVWRPGDAQPRAGGGQLRRGVRPGGGGGRAVYA